MISRDITGAVADGSDKLFNLLALVSNPKLYEEKIKELQDATAQHKKYVDAVGHVDEVLRLRKEDADVAKAAKDKADESNKFAADVVKKAQADAAAIVAAARESAKKLSNDAKEAADKANNLVKQAELRMADLNARDLRLKTLESGLQAKSAELSAAMAEAETAKQDAIVTKNDIIAKHKALIEGL